MLRIFLYSQLWYIILHYIISIIQLWGLQRYTPTIASRAGVVTIHSLNSDTTLYIYIYIHHSTLRVTTLCSRYNVKSWCCDNSFLNQIYITQRYTYHSFIADTTHVIASRAVCRSLCYNWNIINYVIFPSSRTILKLTQTPLSITAPHAQQQAQVATIQRSEGQIRRRKTKIARTLCKWVLAAIARKCSVLLLPSPVKLHQGHPGFFDYVAFRATLVSSAKYSLCEVDIAAPPRKLYHSQP